MAKSKNDNSNILARNKKAFHDYTVLDKLEAGIELRGTEVKSCRAHAITLVDAYVKIDKGEAWLLNAHISPYEYGNVFNHQAKSSRRLLLHKREILKLSIKIKEGGCTVVPLMFYLKNGKVKVQIALCKGKTHADKRDTLRKRQDDMDARRLMGSKNRG